MKEKIIDKYRGEYHFTGLKYAYCGNCEKQLKEGKTIYLTNDSVYCSEKCFEMMEK